MYYYCQCCQKLTRKKTSISTKFLVRRKVWCKKKNNMRGILSTVALILLLHAGIIFSHVFLFVVLIIFFILGYSANQYKLLSVDAGRNITIPPSDILIELLLSFFILLFSHLIEINLYPVKVSKDIKTKFYNENLNRPEYFTFNHRVGR